MATRRRGHTGPPPRGRRGQAPSTRSGQGTAAVPARRSSPGIGAGGPQRWRARP